MEAAQTYVWEGAIPLQIHLHQSEVTTHPPPTPALVLAPRLSYLPLLISLVKPHFASTLPPGLDTIWFEYDGLPLKWYIPTGVLFDLLCAEPERPWNLTVHFRGYPGNVLLPYEGEDSVKWNFVNSLKEADCIINGNCKNVMNMSHGDQLELWQSVLNVNLEAYQRASSNLKIGHTEDEYASNLSPIDDQNPKTESNPPVQSKTEKIPMRVYIRYVENGWDGTTQLKISSWDEVTFVNRPVDSSGVEGKCLTLEDGLRRVLPKLIEGVETTSEGEIVIVRIQGIEPKMEIPMSWLLNNMLNPDHFLHVCLFVKSPIHL